VLADDGSARLFQGLGDTVELGAHLHGEFIEPESRPDATETLAFQSDYPPEVEFAKLKNLTELFTRRFGYAPRSFRAGRYGISRHSLTFLERLGYTVDSSVTPNTWWWRRRGEGVNFLGAPGQPYHPSPVDFRKTGGMKIVEVPVSLVNDFWERFPGWALMGIDPIQKVQRVLINTFLKKQIRCRWVRPTFSTAEEMMSVTEHLVRRQEQRDVVICMLFHSNEAWVDTSPYNRTIGELDAFMQRLERYFDRLFATYEVRSIGLADAAEFAQ
jgi:hypothetical protein